MDLTIRHDREHHKFHADVDGSEARLTYSEAGDGVLDYQSTFVPPDARGQGIAGELVRHALDYAREQGYRVIPSCPYVERWIDAHPDYEELTAKG